MAREQVWFQCIDCGYETDAFLERRFRCPECGDLFEVQREIVCDTAYWHKIINRPTSSDLDRSGVHFFREAIGVAPDEYAVIAGEGCEPYVLAGGHLSRWFRFPMKLWIQLQGKNPSGSFKDKGMTMWATAASYAGITKAGCASTGDTSASGALYAARAGIDFFALLPEGKVTQQQFQQVVTHGGKVIMLPGSFDDCMRVLEELVTDFGVYPANSINPFRIEGHQTTVLQAYREFGYLPDYFVVPMGNCSNASSIGKGLNLMIRMGFNVCTQIIGCQAKAANPLAESFWKAGGLGVTEKAWLAQYQAKQVGETLATAQRIGNPVSHKKAIRAITQFGGAVYDATEEEISDALIASALDGLEVCPQTAVALSGLKRACHEGNIKPNSDVVLISTADGLKFSRSTQEVFPANVRRAKSCQTDEVFGLL